jgi:DNA-binding MarR family transcriptional regulator
MIFRRYSIHVDTKSQSSTRGAAFLLAQVGAHAAAGFSARMAVDGLTAPDAGILGLLAQASGISQHDLANRLGMPASRLVAFIDDLEERDLVRRVRDKVDRRRNSLQLTDGGRAALRSIGRVAQEHDRAVCAALTTRERHVLAELLSRIADQQGLTTGVHPGYRTMQSPRTRPATSSGPVPDRA